MSFIDLYKTPKSIYVSQLLLVELSTLASQPPAV